MDRVLDWGESMYGGYYAHLLIDDKLNGIHAETQKELKAKIKEIIGEDVNLRTIWRIDN